MSTMGFAGGTSGKEPAYQWGRCENHGFHLWVRKFPWSRKRQLTPVSCLENPMDREAWRATVHRVAKNQTRRSNLAWDSSVGKEFACKAGDPGLIPGLRRSAWRKDRLPIPVFLGFPCGSAGKESACYVGGLGLIPGLGRSPGERKSYPLQYSGLENSMDYMYSPCSHKDSHTTEWLSLSW